MTTVTSPFWVVSGRGIPPISVRMTSVRSRALVPGARGANVSVDRTPESLGPSGSDLRVTHLKVTLPPDREGGKHVTPRPVLARKGPSTASRKDTMVGSKANVNS